MKNRFSYFKGLLMLAMCISLAACASLVATQASTVPAPSGLPSVAPSATSESGMDSAFLQKPADGLRVMSYNINWDSIFPVDDPENDELRWFDRRESFARILGAVQPDILCLQEINPQRDAADIAAYLDAILQPQGQGWNVVLVRDTLIASIYPLASAGYEMGASSYIPNLPQAAALVDLPDEQYGAADLYVLCSHFKSGSGISDERQRQRQADALMQHLRDAITSGGNFDLPSNTPYIVMGDFNAYDGTDSADIRTITTGDIDSEAVYGPDFAPDWDGTSLEDVLPSHNAAGVDLYTWRDDAEPFDPGVLDHIMFTDSGLQVLDSFILDTTQLSTQGLAAYGLQREDVLLDAAKLNFDHFPLVVDFEVPSP